MIEEAIGKVERMAIEAQEAKVIGIDGDPTQVYVAHNGTLHKHPIPQPPDRQHDVATLDDLARVVREHKREDEATVWHSDGQVVALLGNEYARVPVRRDRVTMKLITSPVFVRLAQLERDGSKLEQKAFIKLLAFDFDKAGDFGQLIANARSLRFEASKTGESTVLQGRESMGRQVIGEVKGVAEFPEEFTVEYPVYVNPDLATIHAPVTCSLEIDVINEKFIVTPKPDELLAARQHVHAYIGEKLAQLLAEAKVPVYYGKP